MILSQIKKVSNYPYLERYINNFKKVANEVSPAFCAVQGQPYFFLPHVELPLKDVKIFLARPDTFIKRKIIQKGKVKFFVHPEMLSELKEINFQETRWETLVEPTSSTRTVLVKNENFMVKLHLNKRLSRFIRRLQPSSVEHSILISSEIEKSLKNCPNTFGYLPESIGIAYKDFGMIIRENLPRPIVWEKRYLLPLFSLYATDLKNKKHVPFFVQLVEKKKEEPLDFFIEKIIKPLFLNMSYFIKEKGILLEAHGQNVLVEFEENLEITRFIHRDFQSIYVDKEIRKRKNLDCAFRKHIMGEECPKEVSYSLVYDQYLGKYVLDNFVELIRAHWKIPKEKIESRIKETFRECFDAENFPVGCYYLMRKEKFVDNNAVFQKYDESPTYRI